MPRRLLPVLALLALPLALAGLRPAAAADPAGAAPRLEPVACWFSDTGKPAARCYRFHVPENRARPVGRRTVTLPVVVLPAGDDRRADDPLVYIEGGPGAATGLDGDGIERWRKDLAANRVAAGRDLVLFDQRGTGEAEPVLDCPELMAATAAIYARPGDPAAARGAYQAGAERCRDRLQAAGIDLSAYDSAATAADLADLRVALDIKSWNLWAVSYGTRVALDVLRDHPEGVRSAILDSVFPPEAPSFLDYGKVVERLIGKLAADCARQPGCKALAPDLAATVAGLRASLDRRPLEVPVADQDDRRRVFLLDGDRLVETLLNEFYDWEAISGLPLLLSQAARGRTDGLEAAAADYFESLLDPDLADGMAISVECREEYPFERGAPLEAAMRAWPRYADLWAEDEILAACPVWGAGEAGAIESRPVGSDVPVLVLSGDYDPATPPDWAEATVRHLAHGHLVRFPGIGHGVIASDSCADKVVAAFLADPRAEPRAACLADLPGPLFKTR
ncbi:MAG: alpha/beta hydrolase [Dongiaceae bacterium]